MLSKADKWNLKYNPFYKNFKEYQGYIIHKQNVNSVYHILKSYYSLKKSYNKFFWETQQVKWVFSGENFLKAIEILKAKNKIKFETETSEKGFKLFFYFC